MDLTSLMLVIKMVSFLIFAHDLVTPPRPVVPVVQQQQAPVEQTTVEIVYKDACICP